MPQSTIINAAHTVVSVYRQFQGMRLTSLSIQGRHSFTQNNPNTPPKPPEPVKMPGELAEARAHRDNALRDKEEITRLLGLEGMVDV